MFAVDWTWCVAAVSRVLSSFSYAGLCGFYFQQTKLMGLRSVAGQSIRSGFLNLLPELAALSQKINTGRWLAVAMPALQSQNVGRAKFCRRWQSRRFQFVLHWTEVGHDRLLAVMFWQITIDRSAQVLKVVWAKILQVFTSDSEAGIVRAVLRCFSCRSSVKETEGYRKTLVWPSSQGPCPL